MQRITKAVRSTEERVYLPYKIRALTQFMQSEGYSPEVTLANTGLDEPSLASLDTFISLHQLTTVFRNVIAHLTDPLAALKIGRTMHVSNYGLYGYALLCSGSLRKALEFAIRCHQLATPSVRMRLEVNGSYASFSMEDMLNLEEMHQFNMDFQMSLVQALFWDIIDKEFAFSSMHVEYAKPNNYQEYSQFVRTPVFFDEPRTEFRFPKELLDHPLPRSNPITEKMVIELCDTMLAEQSRKTHIIGRIYNILVKDPAQIPTSEQIASQLAMTSRTLRRKLEAQGTSYTNIIDEMRKSLSIEFLRKTRMSIDDIAEHVGFSDTANFRRAFKRWTNKPPSYYRS